MMPLGGLILVLVGFVELVSGTARRFAWRRAAAANLLTGGKSRARLEAAVALLGEGLA